MTKRKKVDLSGAGATTVDITAPCGTPYRALRGISYPTDPKVIAKLLAGESVAWEARGMKKVAAGDVVDDIPNCTVGQFVDKGAIRPYVEGEDDEEEGAPEPE